MRPVGDVVRERFCAQDVVEDELGAVEGDQADDDGDREGREGEEQARTVFTSTLAPGMSRIATALERAAHLST